MYGWLIRPGAGWWRGPEGVRAGWRAAVFAVVLAALVGGEIWLLARLQPPWLRPEAQLSAGLVALNELMLLLPVLAATVVMTSLEGRSILSCGLAGARSGRRLAGGLLAGIAALSLLMALLLASGHAETTWSGLSTRQIVADLFGWLGVCLLVGLTEEAAFRGYLQQALSRGMGFWPAALVTSLVFGLLHVVNAHESIIGIANVCGAGLIFCLGLQRTGSLWWSIGFHAGWDFSENFLYGTHDSGQSCAGALLDTLPHGPAWLSGGLAGPEGSLFGLGVELLVAGGMFLVLRPQPRSF
jgi:uncharacterized protein